MNKTVIPVSFFLGANCKTGYCSLMDSLYNPYEKGAHYILKGGPGSGKSTLMKKAADALERKGYFVERDYCSADPSSLDAVSAPEIGFSILDGTAPHTFDPTLPGVSEHIVDMGAAFDVPYLNSHRDEISQLVLQNKAFHKSCADFLWVASRFALEYSGTASHFVDNDKLAGFVKRLAHREIPQKGKCAPGRVYKRFLSAITPDGVAVQYDSLVALSEKIITIEDKYSAVSPFIMKYLRDDAVLKGYDVYECFCPLFPGIKTEHIIIPELKISFYTENSFHVSLISDCKTVHASRFFDFDADRGIKEKLNFAKRAEKELVGEAVKKMSIAKDIHTRLEEYYIKATDFSVIDEKCDKILNQI